MDIRITKEAIRERKDSGTIDPRMRPRGASAEWLEIHVSGPKDVAFAVGLVEEAARNNA